MGVRLNIQANPALSAGTDTFAPGFRGATTPVMEGAAPEPGFAGQAVTRPDAFRAQGISPSPLENPGNEPGALASADQQVNAPLAATAAGEDTGVEIEGAPAPRLRNLRFMTAAQSSRERELEFRHDRLEQQLEATTNRLQSSESTPMRIDAELERARLRQDLEMVASEISRLRLARVFSGSAATNAMEPAQAPEQSAQIPATATETQPSGESALNLLA